MKVTKLESNVGGKKTAKRAASQSAPRPRAKPVPVTFGVIVGNRGFFPGHLASTGREEMLRALKEGGYDAIALGPND